jgi:glycosyltransferase involved in cell wall biosynthesis
MKNKPPALIILTPGFPESEADSTCLPPLQLFTRLLKKQYPSLEIIVLSFQYPFVKKEYDFFGCRVIALAGRSRKKIHRVLIWLKAWRKLKQMRLAYEIKGLLSFWLGECALVGERFGNKYRLLHYCWMQGQDARESNKYAGWVKPDEQRLIALSDYMVVLFFENYGLRPQHIIPPGIDPAMFSNAPVEKDIDILGAGSLIPLKQYDVFAEVIAGIRKFLPVNAVLCGKGPEEARIRKLIDVLDLKENIQLTGELAHPEVIRNMQRSRLFLHTSNYEGFGVVCIEALYAGAQVISFCRPMDMAISNWHIVKTKEAMIEKAIELLGKKDTSPERTAPFLMQDTVNRIMQLFAG